MVKNSLKSPNKSWMWEKGKELDTLLDFSNAKIGSMDAPEVAAVAYNCRLFEADSSWEAFIFRSHTRESDPGDLAMRKGSLLELQRHLREMLEKILEATKTSHDTATARFERAADTGRRNLRPREEQRRYPFFRRTQSWWHL